MFPVISAAQPAVFRKNEVRIPSILRFLRLLPTRYKTKNSVEKVENQLLLNKTGVI
jgi:hypothetical protein